MPDKVPPVGYDDTPYLPDGEWRVHDGDRPQPRVVTPGQHGGPPSDAIVLFDGTGFSQWRGRDGQVQWTVDSGAMVVNRTGNIETVEHFGDCQLHIEWAAPAEVKGSSQGRGNSGVFLMGLYEIQVLDSSDNITYADGHTAAIYGQYPPLVNASRAPGEWQSYDIVFVAPRFEGGALASPASVTVIHNGVLIHHHQPIQGPTGHKQLASYAKTRANEGPLMLQDHGDPVRFRNIWIRPVLGYDESP